MAIQSSTFNSLPAKEELQRKIEQQRAHIADLTSYLRFIVPVADRFGDRVFEVAAAFLDNKGFAVTPAQLKALADEMATPEGMARYADRQRVHASLLFGGGSGPSQADSG